MKKAPITVLIIRLQACFRDLNISIEDTELERMAIIIHDTMLGQMRKFHTLDHVFEVAAPFNEPLQVLACLFHDMVYYQIDNGLGHHTQRILSQYIEITDNQPVINPTIGILPDWWDILLDIFNFKTGDLPHIYGGLNEFLSATVAMHSLESYLSITQLVKIASCIEGTIPFRGIDKAGNSNFEILAARLLAIKNKYQLQLSEEEIDEILYASVAISNRDVSNFSDTNTGTFLDNTWLLIYESNFIFNNMENFAYSITGYRIGLMKTELFLKNLQTADIFHQYKNTPKQIDYARLTHQAQRNMAVAREYMVAKLCSATILESFAVATGGDVPMAMLVGMQIDDDHQVERAEDYLNPLTDAEKKPFNPKVLHLLASGRTQDSEFDMKQSPITAYVYQYVGTTGIVEMSSHAKDLFEKKITHEDFLRTCPPELLNNMARACAKLAITRTKALEKYFL